MNTPYSVVDNILVQAGVTKNEKDEYKITAGDNGDMVIDIRRAVPVFIEYQGKQEELLTAKATVGEIMAELGYVGNRYQVDKRGDMGVVADMHIRVSDVAPVSIPAKKTVDTNQGNMPYSAHMEMEATAYIPSDGNGSGITATGVVAQHGVVAVDPRVIPLGSKVYIPGYGVAVAADTGGAINGNRIDLCMNTYREAINFGRGTVDVYILD
ncbi:MAG: hypothetical protein K6C05_10045 [Anaerovibrio sp.]|nr:hypothetical protein [Anaerovibrio sp.]